LCTLFSKLGQGRLYEPRLKPVLVDALGRALTLLRNHPTSPRSPDADRSSFAYSVANLAHGVAKLCQQINHPMPTVLFDLLAERGLRFASDMTAQSVSNLAWAFATAEHKAPHLFDALAKHALNVMPSLIAQHVANLAWALATVDHKAPDLFDALAKHTLNVMPTLIAQNVANLAWAFSKAEHRAPILFDALAKHALNIVPTLNEQNVANLAWAFAKQQLSAPALFDALVARAVAVMGGMKSQDVANFSWACATIALPAPAWFASLARRPSQFMPGMNEQTVANLAWSYAVQLALTTGPSDELRAALRSLLAELGRHDAAFWSTMTDEGVSQLVQAHVTLTAHPDRPMSESVPALPAVITQQAAQYRTRLHRKVRNGNASKQVNFISKEFGKQVVRKQVVHIDKEVAVGDIDMLVDLRVDLASKLVIVISKDLGKQVVRIDEEVAVGDMLVDLRVHLASGTTVLVEVDGPSHFVADATAPGGWRTNGATRLKHARLQWQPEPFVSISGHDWDAVKGDAVRRGRFLGELLLFDQL
jgi:hypothetical protein